MRKLLLLLALLVLLSSCGSNSRGAVAPQPISPCQIPALPDPPELAAWSCESDTAVCLTPEEAIALARWARQVAQVELAIQACSLVTRE